MFFTDNIDLKEPKLRIKCNKWEIIFVSSIIHIMSLALPIMVLQVYDRVMLNHSEATLIVLAVSVTVIISAESIMRIIRSCILNWYGAVFEYTIAANAMRTYINSEPLHLEDKTPGQQIQDLNSLSRLKQIYSGQNIVALIDVPFIIIFLTLIWYLAGWLVLVPMSIVILFILFSGIIGKKLNYFLKSQGKINDKRYDFIIDALRGIHTLKAIGAVNLFLRRYETHEEELSKNNYGSAVSSIRGQSFSVLFNELMIIITTAVGAPMVINHYFTTGVLITVILISGRLIQPIQRVLLLWLQIQDAKLAIKKTNKIFNLPQFERKNSFDIKTDNDNFNKGTIEISNLSFEYQKKNIFNNLNLSLSHGDIISIHSKSNARHSSILLKIIAGLIKPNEGIVSVNGINVINYNSEDLLFNIGFINSDNSIFNGTIIDNLTSFNDKYEKEALEIAELLDLDNIISKLPEGYRTKIKDVMSDVLSPGVKQRISIARVLIHKPRIILFDNADKGLDCEGYDVMIKCLNILKGSVTMIINSEDKNVTTLADRHYIIDDNGFHEHEE